MIKTINFWSQTKTHLATKALFIIALTLGFSYNVVAQIKITGTIVDAGTKTPVIGAGMEAKSTADSTKTADALSDIDGSFTMVVPTPGTYILKIFSEGYQPFKQIINIKSDPTDLGKIGLANKTFNIKEVEITAAQTRAVQKGDTTELHADAFKVNTDANAQDLVTKMPGVQVDQTGKVTAHGEQVQRVLVDGKPYFGDDVTIAMKNMPADVVDKVQIFDMMSDQARFTGFDDGNSVKTLNFITKAGAAKTDFGKIYGGYGTDGTYTGGWSLNEFHGVRKISFLGLLNNINQQNFSAQDLLGVMGGGGGGGMGRRGGGAGSGGGPFMVGQQSGITTTNSVGFNYTDVWGKKILVTGSYFFSGGDVVNNSIDNRTYFTKPKTYYNEFDTSHNTNYNHRANLRFEYSINDNNSLLIQPSFTYQKNTGNLNYPGAYLDSIGGIQSSTLSAYKTSSHVYTFSNTALFRHKFAKKGRTLSLNLDNSFNHKYIDAYQKSTTLTHSGSGLRSTVVDQQVSTPSSGFNVKPTITYTEPVSSRSMTFINYAISYQQSNSNKSTFNYNDTLRDYNRLDTQLSNNYKSTYIANIAGIGYRLRSANSKANFMLSANVQHATLTGDQTLPENLTIAKTFDNILPSAIFMYKFSDVSSLRIFYRTNTSTPSVSQLQNVIDNSNPLQLNEGNPDLKQSYTHTLFTRMGFTNTKKARNLFIFLFGSYTRNYITDSTLTAEATKILPGNIVWHQGSQLIKQVNTNGNISARSNITYSFPLKFLKSTLNLNNGFGFTSTPGYLNSTLNTTNTYAFNQGVTLASNISKEVDFTLSYNASYNLVNTTIKTGVNNNYFNDLAVAKLNWVIWKGFFINTEADESLYQTAISSSYDQHFILWNASAGKKFLKKQNADIRLTAFDLLNQNIGIAHNVTDTYSENVQSRVLHRYFILVFTYNLKGTPPPTQQREGGPHWHG